jgi:dihydroorotate dehydrogenase (fumarate)
MIRRLASELPPLAPRKTFIVSVTGSPDDIAACCAAVAALAPQVPFPLALEVNLSCPNIPGRPPPAYDPASLRLYLAALPSSPAIPLGVKTPPYTHAGQYQSLLGTLREERAGAKLSFITATNTLGSCLVMTTSMGGHHGGVTMTTTTGPALPLGDSGGIGGMAGPPLHPLALGNVATIRRMLDEGDGSLRHIAIVGVGGVSDGGGYRRMRAVGASMVGVGTGLGSEGVDVFAKIERDIGSKW